MWTGLLGWWSISSFFFRAPQATFFNWVAAFRHPISPLAWGAIPVAEFLHQLHAGEDESAHIDADSGAFANSPFQVLNEQQTAVMVSASGLYEALGVTSSAALADLRRAYVVRAKAVHPDVVAETGDSHEEMILVNQAWEILRDEKLRAAYDWLEANRQRVVR